MTEREYIKALPIPERVKDQIIIAITDVHKERLDEPSFDESFDGVYLGSQYLGAAFVWHGSRKGHDYWSDVDKKHFGNE